MWHGIAIDIFLFRRRIVGISKGSVILHVKRARREAVQVAR